MYKHTTVHLKNLRCSLRLQVAAEADRLLQQLVGRRVRLLFDERLLTALGDTIAVDDARSGAAGRQNGARSQQTSLAALTQVTLASKSNLSCIAVLEPHAVSAADCSSGLSDTCVSRTRKQPLGSHAPG